LFFTAESAKKISSQSLPAVRQGRREILPSQIFIIYTLSSTSTRIAENCGKLRKSPQANFYVWPDFERIPPLRTQNEPQRSMPLSLLSPMRGERYYFSPLGVGVKIFQRTSRLFNTGL
jgi:hypothetical protein